MKPITEELKFKIKLSQSGLEQLKWYEVFDTEHELIEALFDSKIYTDEDNVPYYKICKGYDFIKGFRRYYKKNGHLTAKQMTQLKRLAAEMAYRIYCI